MRRKKDRSNGITALYERLSRDDDNAGESNSIVHQKQMLEDYAIKHGFTNLVHFTDDGWSGATFDRPSWNRLVEGVKNGEITACICKDMSRIGRDHLQVGFFTDILFREKEVRFLAINNGIDSDRQETSEFAPFLNIMNEWFVRDTSKKIKAVLKSRGSSGNAHTSNIPPIFLVCPFRLFVLIGIFECPEVDSLSDILWSGNQSSNLISSPHIRIFFVIVACMISKSLFAKIIRWSFNFFF